MTRYSRIFRNPSGKFVSRDAMLFHWLPQMLSWEWNRPLHVMLERSMRWCEEQAGDELRVASQGLKTWAGDRQAFAEGRMSKAQIWFKRKGILAEALAKLRELG